MAIPITLTCPFGHTCEKVVDGELQRCRLLVTISGTNEKGQREERTECALAWTPILLVEANQRTNSVGAAVEDFRNEMVRGQEATTQLLAYAANSRKVLEQ